MIAADDVTAYLDRLQLEPEAPSVDALHRLHRAQLERVPYETTWIHMNDLWSVDLGESLHRVARRRRGGYCFHVNGAFSQLLAALGYDVTLHVGGVHGPDGPTPELMTNHLVLLVHGLASEAAPDGTWYVDAGLGDALHDPLPLVPGTYQQGPFEFRLEPSDASFADWQFHHHALGSFTGMVFSAQPTTIDVFAPRNPHLSTSPESGFVKTPTAQRRDADGIDILRGQVLTRVESSVGPGRTLETRDEWFGALAEVFDLPLDDASRDQREALWQRVNSVHLAWQAAQTAQQA
jgi:N-hydroxyarylamine O-acetyltransferase